MKLSITLLHFFLSCLTWPTYYLSSLSVREKRFTIQNRICIRNRQSQNSALYSTNHGEKSESVPEFEFIESITGSGACSDPNHKHSHSDSTESSKADNNRAVAAASSLLGVLLFALAQGGLGASAVSGVALLQTMEQESMPIEAALCNGKPTIVDFYAPWCESCREVAPAMRAIERRYAGSLNVVTLDGTDPKNGGLVSQLRVDGIPHLAFLDRQANILTALVGAVPKPLLEADTEALVQGMAVLPVTGFDAFKDKPSRNLLAVAEVPDLCRLSE